MTKKLILPSLIIFCAAACSDPHSFKKAEDAQDAGREFIRASLDGNYEKASFYLYEDSVNQINDEGGLVFFNGIGYRRASFQYSIAF